MFARTYLVGLLLTLVACSGPDEPGFRLGLLTWPGNEPVHFAREVGAIDSVRIEFVEFESPADLASAFRLSGIDAACLTADFAVDLAQASPDLRIVFVVSESVGADVVLAREEITDASELRGARIGVEVSPLGAHVLDGLLRHAGLEAADVELVSVDVADHREAFDEHDLDALVTYQPYAERVTEDDGLHVVFDSSEIPGEIVDVILTRQSVLETRERSLRHLIDGWTTTLERIDHDPAAFVAFGARHEAVPEETFRRMLAGIEIFDAADNRRLLVEETGATLEVLRRCEAALRRQGLIREPVDLSRLPDGRFFAERRP